MPGVKTISKWVRPVPKRGSALFSSAHQAFLPLDVLLYVGAT
jgi:hypothetical protein